MLLALNFLANLLLKLFVAWVVMVLLGVAHDHDEIVPALGFLTVFWLVVAVAFARTATVRVVDVEDGD